ncbi:hypothetical protein [Jiella pelagia]|uniref:Uncharacterized protein n=1 Tax=Jiella pelagia TaxID=2986949 RepID=A0ABY7BYC4_9HYPH|nr:hypothetical protein [Jiella pelagia]WAP68733.1 hypothetical protein OH818_26350 [Jiella pelagia]
MIEAVRRQVESAHTGVSKIDFDIGLLSEISSADPSMAWRYWLRHHCRCVAGEDLAEGILLFRPSRTLALAVNGDFEQVLRKYRNALLSAQSQEAALRLIREASRKLIRSTNVLRSEADLGWPESLEEYAVNFENLFPMHGDELNYFLEQAQKPEADPASFACRMQTFVGWMVGAVRDQSLRGN